MQIPLHTINEWNDNNDNNKTMIMMIIKGALIRRKNNDNDIKDSLHNYMTM